MDVDLNQLSDKDLVDLNRRIVGLLRDREQARTYRELAKFGVGDKAWFEATDGRRIEGEVLRVSKKTVTLCSGDRRHWRVSPSLLQRISGPDQSTPLFPAGPEELDEEPDESGELSEAQFERNRDRVVAWWDEFKASKAYKDLSKDEQREGLDVVIAFTDFMYKYDGLIPATWDDGALYNICTDVMPRKITAHEEFFKVIGAVLATFFGFLADKGYQKNAESLARRAAGLGDQIVKAASDHRNWGPAKTLATEAQKAGVDLTDHAAMGRFIERRNASLGARRLPASLSEALRQEPIRNDSKVGRNEPCPCGSGRKFKKCCAGKMRVVEGGSLQTGRG